MEKITVDIDKVLDDFEEIEALETNQPSPNSEKPVLESWSTLNLVKSNCIVDKTAVGGADALKEPYFGTSQKYGLDKSSNDIISKENVHCQQIDSQNSSLWDCKIFSDSLENHLSHQESESISMPISNTDVLLKSGINLDYTRDTIPVTTDCQSDSQASAMKQKILPTDPSPESSMLAKDCEQVDKSAISDSTFKAGNVSQVETTISEASMKSDDLSRDHNCDEVESSEKESNQGISQTSASCDSKQVTGNESLKVSHRFNDTVINEDLTCDINDKNQCKGIVYIPPCKLDMPKVDFLDKYPNNVSLGDMDEYLENISEADQAQDEDSGVSSQEDINGNTYNSDITKAEAPEFSFASPSSKCDDDNSACKLEKSIKPHESKCVSDITTCNLDKLKIHDEEFSGNLNDYHSIGELHKVNANDNNDSNLEAGYKVEQINKPIESDSRFKDANINESLSESMINKNNDVRIDNSHCHNENQNKWSNDNVPETATCDNPKNKEESSVSVNSNIPEVKPSNVTENIVHKVESSDEHLDKFPDGSNSGQIDNQIHENVVCAEDSNESLSQKLQRPTTLDLPSRHRKQMETHDETASSGCLLPKNDVKLSNDVVSNLATIDESPKVASDGNIRPQNQIGIVKPFWIPDADAANCMHCGMKFTVIKRRHHCRACGKVLCSRCCNQRAHLAYLNKEDRICQPCADILSAVGQNDKNQQIPADAQSTSSCGSSPNFSPIPDMNSNSNLSDKNVWRPHPNNPEDYCSTIPPLEQIQLSGSRPPPTVMVPVGVLKRGNKPRREPKQVIFSDGIRPGGDLTDLTEPVEGIPAYRRLDDLMVLNTSSTSDGRRSIAYQKGKYRRIVVCDGEGPLPPILVPFDYNGDEMSANQLLMRLQDEEKGPINFAITKNIHVFAAIIKLDCCFGKECWCFTTFGLCTVGQDEVMLILEKLPDEKVIPRDVFKFFTKVYDNASTGTTFNELGHIIFPEGILGNCDHRGFLFVRPTFQCLSKLVVPNTPFLVAILIHKWEVPWAKVFPLRLMLRFGAEWRYYPCSLVSIRFRKPVYFEIGQTIMSVLADLRNYQFTIPVVPGIVVHMEDKNTYVNIPRNRYKKVMKVLSSNNVEHVLALGSNFSTEADSHLVCMQKDEGGYHTQAINIENTSRRVTGASFIVFSGALKSSSGLSAKFSIVEDGLLVQIPQETMVALHMALTDMRDLTIECGQINATEPEATVILQWTKDDTKFNLGVRSPIDGKSLEGVHSLRIHTSTDYAGDHYVIRWTEVFFLENDENGNSKQSEIFDPCRFAETIAQSCCMSLIPYLDQLSEAELTKIGLRVTLDPERDKVGYDIGAKGKPLPATYMNALDSGLIPVISRLSGSTQNEPLALELIFHILIK